MGLRESTERCMFVAMNLKTFLQTLDPAQRDAFAQRCRTSFGHLRNVAYGKKAAEALAIAIERETGGAVTCEELRPDLNEHWSYIRGTAKQPGHPAAQAMEGVR